MTLYGCLNFYSFSIILSEFIKILNVVEWKRFIHISRFLSTFLGRMDDFLLCLVGGLIIEASVLHFRLKRWNEFVRSLKLTEFTPFKTVRSINFQKFMTKVSFEHDFSKKFDGIFFSLYLLNLVRVEHSKTLTNYSKHKTFSFLL